jgi:hypothetical protein
MTNKTISLTDLNTADEDVLVQKLNISSRVAKRIITLRPYETVEQLNKVWGIDPAVLQRIVSLVGDIKHKTAPNLATEKTPVSLELAPSPVEQKPKTSPQKPEPVQAVIPVLEVQPSRKAEKASWKVSLFSIHRIKLGRRPASAPR